MDPTMYDPNYEEEGMYPPGSDEYSHGSDSYHMGSDNYRVGSEDDPDPYYHHTGSGLPGSDSESSEEGDPLQPDYVRKSYMYNAFDYLSAGADPALDPDFLMSRIKHPTSDNNVVDDDDDEQSKAVDPGLFRYNKRVFITALPCLLLTLIMAGETLLLIVSVGAMTIALMTQLGENLSKRRVVVFALLFIPCHVLVVGSVLPLIWLSWYNSLLVGVINLFVILTGGWVIIQFEAFRKEESSLCAMIEQMLFVYYPFVCCSLVTWVLSTVVSTSLIPFIFICIWFVCLQLYLLPAASSFKLPEAGPEDGLSVLQHKTVIYIVIAFVISGPLIHTVLTAAAASSVGLLSAAFVVLLVMLVCLGLFLSTLLSLRQLCEHMGLPQTLPVYVRWVSGVGVIVFSYPVLQELGIVSHFLLYLPVAAAGFTGLGLTLSLKRGKAMSLLVIVGLVVLMCVWFSHLPWALSYKLLGVVPLKLFYVFVGANFVLCVLVIYASWHNSIEVLGLLLLVQSAGLAVCETGLYQAGLYSLTAFQLTGVVAAYSFHRLHVAGKLPRNTAAMASAVQLTKTALSGLGYLLRRSRKEEGSAVVEISAADFLTLLMFVGMVVWLFVYETKEEVTLMQAGKQLTLLMVSLAVSGQSFLLPIGQLLLQEEPTLADLVGLWYAVGGGLVVMYALQHSQSDQLLEELFRVAMVLAGVGAVVMVMQPQFALSLVAVFEWSEVFSLLLIAALLATGVNMHFKQIVISAAVLGICPGIHFTLMVYNEMTVLHFVAMSVSGCLLLAFITLVIKIEDITNTTERFIKLGTVSVTGLMTALLALDTINLEKPGSVLTYPAWRVMFAVFMVVALCLKSLSMKLGPRLPILRQENELLPALPVFGNAATLLAFLLACTQGPEDGLLHDLWCCAAGLILILLQRDSLLFSSLSPSNRATPTVMAAVSALVLSTFVESRLWAYASKGGVFLGILEVISIVGSVPVYVVLAGVMWTGTVWSEKAVVFSLPLNAFVFLLASTYTGWALAVSGLLCGVCMMVWKLPLLPFGVAQK